MGLDGLEGDPQWKNLWPKWQLDSDPDIHAYAALRALAQGRRDEARQELADMPEGSRRHAVLGDLHAVAGDWPAALAEFELAVRLAPDDPVVRIGRAVAMLALGSTDPVVALLETLRLEYPRSPVVSYYLAFALYVRSIAVRAQTRDGELVMASRAQLVECEDIAKRILELNVDDPELVRAATMLLAEARSGTQWVWAPHRSVLPVVIAVVLAVTVLLGGAWFGSVTAVVVGSLLGAAALFVHVVVNRRPAWEIKADTVAPLLSRRGA